MFGYPLTFVVQYEMFVQGCSLSNTISMAIHGQHRASYFNCLPYNLMLWFNFHVNNSTIIVLATLFVINHLLCT